MERFSKKNKNKEHGRKQKCSFFAQYCMQLFKVICGRSRDCLLLIGSEVNLNCCGGGGHIYNLVTLRSTLKVITNSTSFPL